MAIEMFQKYVLENNLKFNIEILSGTSHTAQNAANAYGVPVGNIVKSLVIKVDGEFVLYLVPGDRKLDLGMIKVRYAASEVRMANAEEVKEVTGYSIGGVPPFGHIKKLKTYIEVGFDNNSSLVAAAGSSNSVFKISLEKLKSIISQ